MWICCEFGLQIYLQMRFGFSNSFYLIFIAANLCVCVWGGGGGVALWRLESYSLCVYRKGGSFFRRGGGALNLVDKVFLL